MKKIIVLMFAILMVSISFLSGCNEQSSKTVKNKLPQVSISADSFSVYRTKPVFISIDAEDPDGLIMSCIVDFGDGTISQGYNLTHIYHESGVYLINASVVDDKGAETCEFINITIEEPLSISINSDVTKGTFPLTVSFTGSAEDSIGEITDFHWDFGDGSESNEQNPVHNFETPNSYNVIFTAFSNRGENISDSIQIIAEHRTSFKLSGKIINNYKEKIEVDYSVWWNFGDWNYWGPTNIMDPYTEKDFSCSVKRGDSEYLLWSQWYYLGTDNEGCEIVQEIFNNPSEEDIVYYIEVKNNGEIGITTDYHPPNPPKAPQILSHFAYTDDYETLVYGKIKNIDSSTITDVKIKITLFDASNNVISSHDDVSIFKSLVGSQDISTFSEDFFIDYFHHYTVEIDSFEVAEDPTYSDLVITNQYKEVDDYFSDWWYIKGTIKNSGSRVAKSVKINAIIYDSGGNILDTKYSYIGTMYSGEHEDFSITFYSVDEYPHTASGYEIEISYDV